MSFGFSIGDFIALTQLASKVVSGARSACGAHDELTREVTSLEIVLRLLQREVTKPKSILKSDNAEQKHELATLVEHCNKVLKVLNGILEKYNGLSEEKRRVTKFWKKVRFGNGEMQDLSKIRLELSTHTNVLTMFLNLSTVGSLGKVEEHMVNHSEELRAVRRSVNWVTASMQANAGHKEGSVLTSYANDDKAFWKEFRRELVNDGYSSDVWRKHKTLIKDYVKELGNRGALDELSVDNAEEDIDNDALNNPNISSDNIKSNERLPKVSEQVGQSTPPQTPSTPDIGSKEIDMDEAPGEMSRSNTASNTASPDLEPALGQQAASFDGPGAPAGFYFNGGAGGRAKSFHFSTKGGGEGFSFSDPESIFSEFLRGQAGTTQAPELNVSDAPSGSERSFHYEFSPGADGRGGFSFSNPESMFSEFLGGQTQMEGEDGGKGKEARVETPPHFSQPDRPEGAGKSPGSVFIGNPDGSWSRVFNRAQEWSSAEFQPSPERSTNAPKSASAECPEDKKKYPTHQQSEAEFWVCPRDLEQALEFVRRHITMRDHSCGSYWDEVIHDGQVFVVPISGDEFYVGPGLPSFAYDKDGNRVAVTGTPPNLVVQGRVAEPAEPYNPTPRRRSESPVFRYPSPGGSFSPRYNTNGEYATRRRSPPPVPGPGWGLEAVERAFARAYIVTASGKARSRFAPDEPTPLTKLRSIPVRKIATEADARKHRIPTGYSLKNWDPSREPIMIFGSVMDADSLGKWIYDWTVHYHGAASTLSETAGELWILLIDVSFSVEQAEECMPRIRLREDREMVDNFVESGERLFDKMKKLIRACEDPKIDKAKKTRHGEFKDPSKGLRATRLFIDVMLSSDETSSQHAEKWMTSARLWLMRFGANCFEIFRNPDRGARVYG
ncbi:uncharacterized protein PAC_07670 [Phialocephala subalpina]|uniref:Fungal N-terminal domain-containing protein n=1 Tax=Phialocephala subalpina TaxID=576137 RepID=A0A1L7WYD3_9HELO|nr:uncharacterized protein PAC_07670 [Phialocephala subalpina]